MNLSNATQIFMLQPGLYTMQDIKLIYRKLARVNHPDCGGSVEMMQLINTAYEDFCKYFISNADYTVRDGQVDADGFDSELIRELKAMQGVIIEIIGYWIWLFGNTYLHKDNIKGFGFKFSNSRKAWYWSPTLSDKKRRGSGSMTMIRNKFGSTIITSDQIHQLSA